MTFRVTTTRRPTAAAQFLLVARPEPRVDWQCTVPRPLQAAAWLPLFRPFEQRRLAREQHLRAQEEHWLWIAAMTDAQVVGLEPRGPSLARAARAAVPQAGSGRLARNP